MNEHDASDAPDLRTLLASAREQAELTYEQTMALCRELIVALETELEAIDRGELPSAGATQFANETWSDFYTQKRKSAETTARHLVESIGFIDRAPGPLEGAMVVADQALALQARALEFRAWELGVRIVAAVHNAAAN
jgi:hypothetical protein